MDVEIVYASVGGTIVKIGLTGAGLIFGPGALLEATDVLAQQLTELFGKQEKDANIDDIEHNELDGTLESTIETATGDIVPKQLVFDDWQDADDIFTTTVSYKNGKFEALASTQPSKITEHQRRPKKIYRRIIKSPTTRVSDVH